jgi:hypothetical protein
LHLHDGDATAASRLAHHFRVADVNVRVEAPERILAIVDTMLARVPRFDAGDAAEITLVVTANDDAWEIDGGDGTRQLLSGGCVGAQIAGALVSTAVRRVAANRAMIPMRAAVMERNGRALGMVGDDWESAITLAAHLHARGWHYVGGDHALFDPATRAVACVQKSLYINSSSISQLPTRYRRAVEASPWYVTPQGISFYAVDPNETGTAHAWSSGARLCALVVVDGTMVDNASLESVEARQLQDERFARYKIDWDQVAAVDLRIGGGYVETSDLIEHWFGGLPF